MELNVWTSTTVQNIDRDDSKDEFVVTLIKADGSKRIMRPKHIVMAIGLAGNEPKMPDIPGMVRCADCDQVARFLIWNKQMSFSLNFKEGSCIPCTTSKPQIM
jgi:hypothetical protein